MMLTALGDAQSEITGLISGADDYIAKPFNYEVFLARVHSMTRKAKKSKEKQRKGKERNGYRYWQY